MKEFTIKVKMQERWIAPFMSMLKYMQTCGSVGASRLVGFYSDGDGDFRPEFEADIEYEVVDPVDGYCHRGYIDDNS